MAKQKDSIYATDGGAKVPKSWSPKSHGVRPTVTVTEKASGTEMVISAAELAVNPDLYTAKKGQKAAPAAKQAKPLPSELELGSMSLAQIEDTDEFEALPDPKPTRKAEAVAAIVAARKFPGRPTEAELQAMSFQQLQELPEFVELDQRPANKPTAVTAILAARRRP